MKPDFIIVSGNVNRDLAIAIAQLLNVEIGKCRVERFPDTEVNVQLDESVRDRDVFIVQSSCPPVNERAMEAFAIADACRRDAASSITWIAPYFGYARSDKRRGRRTALMGPATKMSLPDSTLGRKLGLLANSGTFARQPALPEPGEMSSRAPNAFKSEWLDRPASKVSNRLFNRIGGKNQA